MANLGHGQTITSRGIIRGSINDNNITDQQFNAPIVWFHESSSFFITIIRFNIKRTKYSVRFVKPYFSEDNLFSDLPTKFIGIDDTIERYYFRFCDEYGNEISNINDTTRKKYPVLHYSIRRKNSEDYEEFVYKFPLSNVYDDSEIPKKLSENMIWNKPFNSCFYVLCNGTNEPDENDPPSYTIDELYKKDKKTNKYSYPLASGDLYESNEWQFYVYHLPNFYYVNNTETLKKNNVKKDKKGNVIAFDRYKVFKLNSYLLEGKFSITDIDDATLNLYFFCQDNFACYSYDFNDTDDACIGQMASLNFNVLSSVSLDNIKYFAMATTNEIGIKLKIDFSNLNGNDWALYVKLKNLQDEEFKNITAVKNNKNVDLTRITQTRTENGYQKIPGVENGIDSKIFITNTEIDSSADTTTHVFLGLFFSDIASYSAQDLSKNGEYCRAYFYIRINDEVNSEVETFDIYVPRFINTVEDISSFNSITFKASQDPYYANRIICNDSDTNYDEELERYNLYYYPENKYNDKKVAKMKYDSYIDSFFSNKINDLDTGTVLSYSIYDDNTKTLLEKNLLITTTKNLFIDNRNNPLQVSNGEVYNALVSTVVGETKEHAVLKKLSNIYIGSTGKTIFISPEIINWNGFYCYRNGDDEDKRNFCTININLYEYNNDQKNKITNVDIYGDDFDNGFRFMTVDGEYTIESGKLYSIEIILKQNPYIDTEYYKDDKKISDQNGDLDIYTYKLSCNIDHCSNIYCKDGKYRNCCESSKAIMVHPYLVTTDGRTSEINNIKEITCIISHYNSADPEDRIILENSSSESVMYKKLEKDETKPHRDKRNDFTLFFNKLTHNTEYKCSIYFHFNSIDVGFINDTYIYNDGNSESLEYNNDTGEKYYSQAFDVACEFNIFIPKLICKIDILNIKNKGCVIGIRAYLDKFKMDESLERYEIDPITQEIIMFTDPITEYDNKYRAINNDLEATTDDNIRITYPDFGDRISKSFIQNENCAITDNYTQIYKIDGTITFAPIYPVDGLKYFTTYVVYASITDGYNIVKNRKDFISAPPTVKIYDNGKYKKAMAVIYDAENNVFKSCLPMVSDNNEFKYIDDKFRIIPYESNLHGEELSYKIIYEEDFDDDLKEYLDI